MLLLLLGLSDVRRTLWFVLRCRLLWLLLWCHTRLSWLPLLWHLRLRLRLLSLMIDNRLLLWHHASVNLGGHGSLCLLVGSGNAMVVLVIETLRPCMILALLLRPLLCHASLRLRLRLRLLMHVVLLLLLLWPLSTHASPLLLPYIGLLVSLVLRVLLMHIILLLLLMVHNRSFMLTHASLGPISCLIVMMISGGIAFLTDTAT